MKVSGSRTNSGGNQFSKIETATKVKGDIRSDSDVRIDGELVGTIHTKGRVIIGKNGLVDGLTRAGNADIEGKFKGKLTITELLSIKASADIEGEVTTQKLMVEPGAQFNANCIMKVEHAKKEVQKSGVSHFVSR